MSPILLPGGEHAQPRSHRLAIMYPGISPGVGSLWLPGASLAVQLAAQRAVQLGAQRAAQLALELALH